MQNDQRERFVPDKAGMWILLVRVSGGRKAHLGLEAASCIAQEELRNASRLHSRRREGKWRFQHLHSKPEQKTEEQIKGSILFLWKLNLKYKNGIYTITVVRLRPVVLGKTPAENQSKCS